MDRILEKKKWYQKRKVWIAAGSIILLLFLYIAFLSDTTTKLNVEKDKITIDDVKKDFFKDYMATIGTVQPIRTIYLDAMEGGRVEEIIIEEGNMVNKGDVILRLSNPNLNLNIMNSEAELAEKTNWLRDTKLAMEQNRLNIERQILDTKFQFLKQERTYKNNKKFYEKNLISEEEYLVSKDEYEYAKASLELYLQRKQQDSIYRKVQVEQLENSLSRMKENLVLVTQKLENLMVKAPISGQLGMLNAEIGEQIGQGQRLGLIHVLDSFKVRAEIDEHYISRVRRGLPADFDFNEKTYKLTVKKVFPEVRNGRFEVDLTFPGEVPDKMRTGQTFRVKLELGEPKDAVIIPRGGFYQTTGGQWIFVVNETGNTAEKRSIKTGRQNPQFYEILEGLNPGEKVITSGYENFGLAEKLVLK